MILTLSQKQLIADGILKFANVPNFKQGNSKPSLRKQIVMSEPSKILVGSKIVGKNKHLKNTYKSNPNAKPIKTIYHSVN